jgi:diacylglycerol kinase family enzyme
MSAAGRRVRVILNAKSGDGHATAGEIRNAFEQYGCKCTITELGPGVDLGALASEDEAGLAWVAAGGDGTVNAVAGVVAGTERVMAVLPVGTLNHFARDMNMPGELAQAIEVVARCGWRAVDAADANGRVFVNCSSLGIYPEVVMDRDRLTKRRGWSKWAAMLVAATKAFVRFRQLRVELEVDGTVRRFRTPLLFVGNNAYQMDGNVAGQRSCLDQGELEVIVASHMSRWAAARMVVAAMFGRAGELPELEQFFVTRFTVRTRKHRLRVAVDGEVCRMAPPVTYCSRPGALRVIAPDGQHEVGA